MPSRFGRVRSGARETGGKIKQILVYGILIGVLSMVVALLLIPPMMGDIHGAERLLFSGIIVSVVAASGASVILWTHGFRSRRRRGQA